MDLGLHRRLTAAEGSSLPFNQSNLKNQTEKKKAATTGPDVRLNIKPTLVFLFFLKLVRCWFNSF